MDHHLELSFHAAACLVLAFEPEVFHLALVGAPELVDFLAGHRVFAREGSLDTREVEELEEVLRGIWVGEGDRYRRACEFSDARTELVVRVGKTYALWGL